MKRYFAHHDYKALSNSIVDIIELKDIIGDKFKLSDAFINIGGWQSWNPGYEIMPDKKQPSLKCRFIKGWNKYLVFPESQTKCSRNIVTGQFVTYLRWNNFYAVFASVGNKDKALPPVQFIFNRKENKISIEICDKGADWKKNDITAEIEIFTANSYFECKEKLGTAFGKNHFEQIKSLGNNFGGWESWYNHYSNINQKLIEDDLTALKETENIISKGAYSSLIFQIDDGWEQSLGDWDSRDDRFPSGLKYLAEKIESKNYIPGIWCAPFIIDSRSKTAEKHPQWLLRDSKGELVDAGYNPLWGSDGTFYCLDLSRDDVLEHLVNLMDKIIDEWGFRYIKLDFLYSGMLFGNYTNKSASYKIYDNALKKITCKKTTKDGKNVYYLGCGAPFELSFRYLPLSRIGCDTYEHWKNKSARLIGWNGRNEAYLNLKDTLGHAMWNKTIFANDPDVVFIRSKKCSLTKEEKFVIAGINTLFAIQFMYSDDPAYVGEEENKLTDEILEFRAKYENENFGLRQVSEYLYTIFSESGRYSGEINIGKNRYIKILENK